MTKIFVAGHNGMVGSAICRQFQQSNIEVITASRKQLDLTNQTQVKKFFSLHNLDQVYIAAAKVGGIYANDTYPADFIYNNLIIECNLINSAFNFGVKKLLFLGSSCIYPKLSSQPIKENQLLNGFLEPTNEPYAIAKIAGIKLCESYNRQYGDSHNIDYRCVMPTNLYGPGDNYHPKNSHVIPALIRKFHEAKINNNKTVSVWGSGKPKREFLHVDDLAKACLHIMNIEKGIYLQNSEAMCSHINVGSGVDISINNLAMLIKQVVGFKGKIVFDQSKPDGSFQKLMDSSRANSLGWKPEIDVLNGLKMTYLHYVNSLSHN